MKKLLIILFLILIPSTSFSYVSVSGAENFNQVLDAYRVVDIDEGSASPRYYGYLRFDGYWFIMKAVVSSGVTTYTFAKGTTSYSSNWTGRAGLSYATWDNVFNTGI